MPAADTNTPPPLAPLSLLFFALIFPTIYTWLYFDALAGTPAARVVYALGKLLQFSLPAAWWLFVARQPLRWPRLSRNGLAPALAFGCALLLLPFPILQLAHGTPLLTEVRQVAAAKLADFGLDSAAGFALLASFYCLLHSLLEEYYWRWFVCGQLHAHGPRVPALLISSLGFMAHHVVVIARYVHQPALILLASLTVAAAGAFWAWLWLRHRSLLAPWLSHLLADAAIMTAGALLLFPPP